MARNKFDVDETLETPFSLKHLKRSAIYIKKHKKTMILALCFSAAAVIASLIDPLVMQRAMDYSIPQGNKTELLLLGGVLICTIALNIILTTLRSRMMVRVSQSIVYDIRMDLFKHLQKLPFEYYDNRPHGKILVRVVQYVNNVSDILSNGIINFVLEIFNLIFILIFMLCTSPKLTLVVLAGLPIFLIILFILKPIQRRAWQQVSNKNSNMNAYLNESIEGAKITQVYCREDENMGIFDRLNRHYRKAWMKAIYSSNLIPISVQNISTWVLGVLYIVGVLWMAPDALSVGVTVGTITAMGSYASRFWQPIQNLANLYNNFINSIAYLERIFETMDEPVTVDDIPGASTLPEISGDVSFKDVTFSYDGTVNILEGLNFEVKAGESIALVGPTGAGKTTIVNLISRFYNLNGGQVLIDGHDISKVTLHSLRSQMGIMLQDSFIFSGTIAENIRYGKLDATDEEVLAACQTVCADHFINTMEQGFDTLVNERGSRLSQGQKQLISFARTLLSDPKILILDEATSSIDTKTERDLQQGLQNLLKGRTSFIIAHRLSTIKNCDKIMYVSNKGITECGTHDELMAKQGDYYRLYTSQLSV